MAHAAASQPAVCQLSSASISWRIVRTEGWLNGRPPAAVASSAYDAHLESRAHVGKLARPEPGLCTSKPYGQTERARELIAEAPQWPSESVFRAFHDEFEAHTTT
jgi:hypothetical protein